RTHAFSAVSIATHQIKPTLFSRVMGRPVGSTSRRAHLSQIFQLSGEDSQLNVYRANSRCAHHLRPPPAEPPREPLVATNNESGDERLYESAGRRPTVGGRSRVGTRTQDCRRDSGSCLKRRQSQPAWSK